MSFTIAQLQERRGFLGASEAAAALGVSSWFTPLELYRSKVEGGEPIEATIPMMVGTALEPVTIAIFEKQNYVEVSNRQDIFVDPVRPWRRATIDGALSDTELVEAKTSGDFRGWGEEEDAVPLPYVYNAHHTFGCIPSAKIMHFPVLIGGRTYKHYIVKRDQVLVDLVARGEELFWGCVTHKRTPPPINQDDLRILYPKDIGTTIPATPAIEAMLQAHARVKAEMRKLDKQEEELKFQICEFMGASCTLERQALVGNRGEVLATWNTQYENRINVTRLRMEEPAIAARFNKEQPVRKLLNKIKVQ